MTGTITARKDAITEWLKPPVELRETTYEAMEGVRAGSAVRKMNCQTFTNSGGSLEATNWMDSLVVAGTKLRNAVIIKAAKSGCMTLTVSFSPRY